MVVPELHLLEIKRIVLAIYAVILVKSFLREAPESFQSVDVVPPAPKRLLVVDPTMFSYVFSSEELNHPKTEKNAATAALLIHVRPERQEDS